MRFFNTEGPVRSDLHYLIPPLTRLDLDEVLMLIEQHKYFLLHAPRQVGKTSFMLAMADHLNEQGWCNALYFSVESAKAMRENVEAAMRVILGAISTAARDSLGDPFPEAQMQQILAERGTASLEEMLTRWAQHSEKPLVLFIDEIDTLIGDTLISVLSQLRSGYYKRPADFPQSIILCGVRNLHDYRIHASSQKEPITGGSAFNIKAKSLRMGDFDRQEVEILLGLHTEETGQIFRSEAIDLIWQLSNGQPWLANALAYRVCFDVKKGRDRSQPITPEMVLEAKEQLILERVVHIDQLIHKLEEARVQRVIEPILAGESIGESVQPSDISYVRDLGLISSNGRLEIANPIYKEVIPRELTYGTQVTLTQETAWYLAKDGSLDMQKLLTNFQQFFREHSEHWVERFQYKEAGPQLLLQAFLQRVINGGGQIIREYGLGRQRTDLLIIWPYDENFPAQRIVLELKIRYGDLEETIAEGLEQTWRYMDKSNAISGHFIVFDRALKKPWDEKIFVRDESYSDVPIKVWGM